MSKRKFKWKVFFRLLKSDLHVLGREIRFQREVWWGVLIARIRARQTRKACEERQALYEISKPLHERLQTPASVPRTDSRKEKEF